MKAGDIKSFLGALIEGREQANPERYNIHDNFILSAVSAFKKGESPEHIKMLVDGSITTEELTAHRRVAVLKMMRDVLAGLAKPGLTNEDRERLRGLLTAYYV
mgnify:CR=1 FL=1